MSTSALSSRNYLIYLAGSTVSLHGLWIYRVALGWFAWQLSGSELWVGIVAFTQFAPAVVFGPLFGVLADRFSRRKASLLINSLSAMNMLLLSVLTTNGQVDIAVLAIISLMQGTLDGAHSPVRMTIVPNLVNKEQLHSAIAHSSISFNVSRFVGPAIAGIIIVKYGVDVAFAVNGISYLALVAAVLAVQLNPTVDRSAAPGNVWSDMLVGIRYVLNHKTIRALLIIIAVASVLGRGALEMMPAFVDVVFQRGSGGLAMLTSALGAGAIATGLVLARGSGWLSVRIIRIGVTAAGFLVAALASSDAFWLAMVTVTLLGVLLSMCGVGSQILIQTLVEDEVRGRVSSLWGMIAFGGTAIGSLVIGIAASIYGLQNTVIVAGLLCAAAALLTTARAR
jgi:MFS family permease